MNRTKRNLISIIISAFLCLNFFAPSHGQTSMLKMEPDSIFYSSQHGIFQSDTIYSSRNSKTGFVALDLDLSISDSVWVQKKIIATNNNEIIYAQAVPVETRQKNRRVEMTIEFELFNKQENKVYKYWWKNKATAARTVQELSRFCSANKEIKTYEAAGSATRIYEVICKNDDGSVRAKKIFIGELSFQ